MDDYTTLHEISKESALLGGASGILSWDQETHMPDGGGTIRAEQLALLSALIHRGKTGKRFQTALEKLIDLETGQVHDNGLSREQKAALREWRRDFLLATRLPEKFVKESALLVSESQQVWASAREDNAFARFAPYLERIVEMCRQKAELVGYEEDPYDALIDEHEPGMTRKRLRKLFGDIKGPITELRKRTLKKKQPVVDFLYGSFSPLKQMAMGEELLAAVAFDPEYSRIDESAHPFCLATHPTDGRITSHIHPKNPMFHLSALVHEGGHLLYERNLPAQHYGSPLCEAVSTAIHESQSRWWEAIVGQSMPFWRHFFPRMQHHFPKQLGDVTLKQFVAAINVVKSTPIRVDSDELSYPLHVILRFEIETALLEGSLQVRDLPDRWQAGMEELLGITPKNQADGCLQDIHWSMGAIGYFPTYALGNIYAAQFFAAFEQEHGNWAKEAAVGDFSAMRKWLQENIHQHGRAYSASELCKRITGRTLSSEPYLNYLLEKY